MKAGMGFKYRSDPSRLRCERLTWGELEKRTDCKRIKNCWKVETFPGNDVFLDT